MNKKLIVFISVFFILFVGINLFRVSNDEILSNENLKNKGEVYYIDNDYTYGGYSKEFSVSKNNGDLLSISVDNVGKNDFYLDFSRNNKSILDDVLIKGGETFFREFSSDDFKLSGKFEVYLYTMDGSRASANISVVQK